MKILHILKDDPNDSIEKIIGEHKKGNEVEIIDLNINKDYAFIVELIERADKVITW